ncbi:MAG TPA: cupin domain-containing protein, partial [Caulobacteraceae bacterium]
IDLRAGMLDLADASREISREDYVGENEAVDRGAVARQHQQGATIIVQQMQNSDAVLGDFCRAIEARFSSHSQTNIYLTPAGAQGFGIHYDNHDVFVLQVEGEKAWRIYGTPVSNPYRGEGFEPGVHETGPITHEFVLKAGDCAYIPRGVMHDASASGDGPSLHVTVGLIVKTWAELMLEAASQVALEEPAFRRALPPGFARRDYDRDTARKTFAELARILADKAKMDDAFDLMTDQFIRSREPDVSGAIFDASRASAPGDQFLVRATAPWRLADDGEKLVVITAGGDVPFDPADRAALERALSGQAFGEADLACEDPREMARKLQAFGLVERAE